MCGISGISKFINGVTPDDLLALQRMMDEQIHRGPDDFGCFNDRNIVFGHRRLSIIDLSICAKQPMCNEDKTIWIVYNGEIYNYKEIQKELIKNGHKFKSNSDTEVIIHGFEQWGIEELLKKLRGMFAFVIYDSRNKQLTVARDRLGIKPLYYSNNNGSFIFASEIKAILASKLIAKSFNFVAIRDFLLQGFIAPPITIINGIYALEPGHYLTVNAYGIKTNRYYKLEDAFLDDSLKSIKENESIEMVHACLTETIKGHLVSDVPVGAFLSGGIDSSSIVSLMRELDHRCIKTISIVFPNSTYDESKYAETIARKFNTDHSEIEINTKDLVSQMEKIFLAMDQPTVDGINTYFVAQVASQAGLKVAMAGIGGDEIFLGYPSFIQIPRLHRLLQCLSMLPFRKNIAGGFIKNLNFSSAAKFSSMVSNARTLPEIYAEYRNIFTMEQIQNLLQPDYAEKIIRKNKPIAHFRQSRKIDNDINMISYLETTSYMANQLLRDTDVFSMAHSLEVRVPFVDHVLIELLAKLPLKHKISKNIPKKLLVNSLRNQLPDEIIQRRKMGFTFPFDTWLRNELKACMKERLLTTPIFNKSSIVKLLDDFEKHKVHWSKLWNCLILAETLKG